MDMKKCKTCGAEKPNTAEYFYAIKTTENGTVITRNECKDCKNSADKVRKGGNTPRNKPSSLSVKTETPVKYHVPNKEKGCSCFTQEEVERIKHLINGVHAPVIYEPQNGNRTPKTFNIDDDIFSWLNAKSKEDRISISSIVNTALRKFITPSQEL